MDEWVAVRVGLLFDGNARRNDDSRLGSLQSWRTRSGRAGVPAGPRMRPEGRLRLVHGRRGLPCPGSPRGIGGELPAGSSTEAGFPQACQIPSGLRSTRDDARKRRWTGRSVCALMLRPDYAEAHNNLGNALHYGGLVSTRPPPATGSASGSSPNMWRPTITSAMCCAGGPSGRGDRQLHPCPRAEPRPRPCPPQPGDGMARDGGLPARLA